jgi:hypothetical protein
MHAILTDADQLLRSTGRFDVSRPLAGGRRLVVLVLVFAPLYGMVMGSFAFDAPERLLQVLYSGVKLPVLLFSASLVCLPAFFVLNTVLGLRDDFGDALRAILAGQAGLSIVLASLAPLTRFWYFCHDGYRAALLFNLAALGLATLTAQWIMFRHYRRLIARHPCHRLALLAWLILYAFVGIQMAWTLRPFVGSPGMAVTFFREEPFTNAYVVVAGLIFGGS